MAERQIPLTDAKVHEMRDFAKRHLGITFPVPCSEQSMRAQIGSAWDKPSILVSDSLNTGGRPKGSAAKKNAAAPRSKIESPAIIQARDVPAAPPNWRPPDAGQQGVGGPTFSDPTRAPKVRCIIHQGPGQTGGEPVWVAVNGIPKEFPRGEVLEIPLPYYEALTKAIERRYYQKFETDDKGAQMVVTTPREEPAYPMQLLAT